MHRLPPHSVPRTSQAVEPALGAKAHRLELAAHRLDEAGFGDCRRTSLAAEVVAGQRAGPGACPGVCQQAELQRGEVALADPARAALDAARHRFQSMRSSSRVRP